MHILRIAASLAVLATALPIQRAYAAEDPLPTQSYEGISFVTGGVGLEEREQISRIGRDYNLKLMFAERGGDYLGNVKVVVAKPAGKTVLEATADGPILLARLPQGTYRITVSADGKDQVRTAQVPAHGQGSMIFRW
ncbi:MAG TPA: carboxypeptidase-like regulatory domain-containing protein [Aromatoleum sp.]|uniref:carboxypeptidase-like regulatory domain-containing protein n=1 Tax=Aromatoleum sp. TaxID=2307007 RepID=UPI002B4712FE|nr:carboxypeptidase-like regulatory domain-containing protein [Aromatoleum sp.]HJV26903.1 carboxypeptidase-like regulatory domain-containing protein [Aromatoleum sp.]